MSTRGQQASHSKQAMANEARAQDNDASAAPLVRHPESKSRVGSEKRNARQEARNLGTLVAKVHGSRQGLDESAGIETRAQRLHDAAGEGAKLGRGVGQVCR